jgi:hypothetical protein
MIVVDSTELDVDEVVDKMVKEVRTLSSGPVVERERAGKN